MDSNTGECLKTLIGHTDWINTVCILDNDKIVSGSHDKTIKIWNSNTGECIKTLTGHTSFVNSVCILNNDKIVSGSHDKTIKIWY